MAGGVFKLSSPKVRPGVYVNVLNGRQPTAVESKRGIAVIPLIGYDWGPREEWIHLTAESPDAERMRLGRSIYDDNEQMMLLLIIANECYGCISLYCRRWKKGNRKYYNWNQRPMTQICRNFRK